MPRRKAYTRVIKKNEIREDHVKGMGDVVFKGLQCLNSQCEEFIFIPRIEIGDIFEISCPSCGFSIRSGDETQFYEYELKDLRDESIIEEGRFTILHDDYIDESQEYKYCIVCNTLKPVHLFDRHKARKSGRQGECKLCKKEYNAIKNQTRLEDQHREAAQKRRLYLDLSDGQKINQNEIRKRFNNKCFKCGKNLRGLSAKEAPIDHTLPALFLWPLLTETATLLCQKHNSEKSGGWPSDFYTQNELKKLSVLTGISFDILAGLPHYNPDALERLRDPNIVDGVLQKYTAYMQEIVKLRNRILEYEGIDFFESSYMVSPAWIRRANEEYERTVRIKVSKESNIDEK